MTLKQQLFTEAVTAGVPYREIAAAMNVTTRSLFRWRRKLGLPNRQRGRWREGLARKQVQ